MIGFVLKWLKAAWSLHTKKKIQYSRYSRVGVPCFSSKNAGESPVMEHYRIVSDHARCTWDKMRMILAMTQTQSYQAMPCFSVLTSTSFTCCCGFGENNKSETKAKQKVMLHCKPATIWDFRMFIWKSRVGSFARTIGACNIYSLRKGLTLISGSMKLTPHLHDAKHFVGYSNLRTNLIYFRAGVIFPSNNIWEYQLKVAEVFYLSIFHQLWPPIQPNLDELVTDLELCVDCCTVGQVNQDQRLPVEPAQSKECCPENAMAFPMGGQKSSWKGPKPNVKQKSDKLMMMGFGLHQTPSLSKWLSVGDKKCAPSVLSPCRSLWSLKTTS